MNPNAISLFNNNGSDAASTIPLTFNPPVGTNNNFYMSGNDSQMNMFSRVQTGLVLTFQLGCLLLILNLLLFARYFCWGQIRAGARKIPAAMRLFLTFHAIFLFIGIPAYLQKAFTPFDPYTQFYVVLLLYDFAAPYNFIQPFLNFILTLERILVLRQPLWFSRYRQHYIWIAALVTPLVYLLTLMWYLFELPEDQTRALCCPPLINNSLYFKFIPQTCIKLTLGAIDLGSSIFFFIWLNKEMGKKLKNRVVKFTVICEIVFEIIPSFALQIANLTSILSETLKLFLINLSTVVVNINLMLCVLYYSWIFLVVAQKHTGSTKPMIALVPSNLGGTGRAVTAPANSSSR